METEDQIPPKKPFYKKILKFFLWIFVSAFLLLGTGIALVFVYEDEVKAIVIKELNKHLATEVRIDPKNIDLTFISSFPKCAIEFKKLTAYETFPAKEKDTLIYAESLSLQFSLKDLFEKKYNIKQITLADARCFFKVNKQGLANYEIWKTKGTAAHDANDSLSFKLEDISLKNIFISYKNSRDKVKTAFVIEDITFKGNFSETSYVMEAEGELHINSVTADKLSILKNKNLSVDVALDVTGNKYALKKAGLSLNKMVFDVNGVFIYKDSLENLNLDYKARNVDIESVLSLLPEQHKARIKEYKSSGDFFVEGNLNFVPGKPLRTKTNFGIRNATIEYTAKNTQLTNVAVAGELLLDKQSSFLRVKSFNASLNDDKISGNFYLENFDDPSVEASAECAFDLKNLYSFWPIDTLEKLEGALKFKGNIKGRIKDLEQNAFSDKVMFDLDISIEKLAARFKNDKQDVAIASCKIAAHERDIRVEDFKMIKGSSDIDLSGEIPGMFNYVLDNTSPLTIKGKLESKNLAMEDLIFPGGNSSSQNEFNIPANISLSLDAGISHFTFGKFEANNIQGNFELKNQKAMVSDMKLETMGGEAVVNAYADASGKELEVTFEAGIKRLNVKKLFYQVNNFGQSALLDRNINGLVSAQIDFTGNWNKKLQPVLSSIVATSDFTIAEGELIDFKPLESLARFVELQELKRIKFSTLSSKIEIKKNTIYIPQTTIKNSVLNIDFNGTHTFNNEIDYHVRLLISELLAKKRKPDDEFGPVENDPDNRRSAFILMTGNIDNPVIKYDKSGMKQKIKEDIKQEKQNLKQLLKEEFGAFKKDTVNAKTGNKADQRFELEKPNNNTPKKTLEPKKKKEDDDDF